jgi:hypothetical protein
VRNSWNLKYIRRKCDRSETAVFNFHHHFSFMTQEFLHLPCYGWFTLLRNISPSNMNFPIVWQSQWKKLSLHTLMEIYQQVSDFMSRNDQWTGPKILILCKVPTAYTLSVTNSKGWGEYKWVYSILGLECRWSQDWILLDPELFSLHASANTLQTVTVFFVHYFMMLSEARLHSVKQQNDRWMTNWK